MGPKKFRSYQEMGNSKSHFSDSSKSAGAILLHRSRRSRQTSWEESLLTSRERAFLKAIKKVLHRDQERGRGGAVLFCMPHRLLFLPLLSFPLLPKWEGGRSTLDPPLTVLIHRVTRLLKFSVQGTKRRKFLGFFVWNILILVQQQKRWALLDSKMMALKKICITKKYIKVQDGIVVLSVTLKDSL